MQCYCVDGIAMFRAPMGLVPAGAWVPIELSMQSYGVDGIALLRAPTGLVPDGLGVVCGRRH